MFDKREKAHGVVVGAHTILRELGHPSDWARDERKLEFRNRLRGNSEELDISGIRGCPGRRGYLDYLRSSAADPLGSETGLVSAEVNEDIKQMVIAEVEPEILKYEARLAELEKSPGAVLDYIFALILHIDILQLGIDPNPADQPMEELQELSQRGNVTAITNIVTTIREMAKYIKLLKTLQS